MHQPMPSTHLRRCRRGRSRLYSLGRPLRSHLLARGITRHRKSLSPHPLLLLWLWRIQQHKRHPREVHYPREQQPMRETLLGPDISKAPLSAVVEDVICCLPSHHRRGLAPPPREAFPPAEAPAILVLVAASAVGGRADPSGLAIGRCLLRRLFRLINCGSPLPRPAMNCAVGAEASGAATQMIIVAAMGGTATAQQCHSRAATEQRRE